MRQCVLLALFLACALVVGVRTVSAESFTPATGHDAIEQQVATFQEQVLTVALHPKVIAPEGIFTAFGYGDDPKGHYERAARTGKGNFIVTFTHPEARSAAPDLRSAEGKALRAESVATTQETVLTDLAFPDDQVKERYASFYGMAVSADPWELGEILDHPLVKTVELDEVMEVHDVQGIELMQAAEARAEHDGYGLSIAICDTGIDYTHPQLGGGGFPNGKVIGGRDTGEDDDDPMDKHSHGTACAGISAGDITEKDDYTGGVAPAARLYALKVSSTETGGSASSSDIVEAWDWAVTHQNDNATAPIMVISTSFGGGKYTSPCNGAYETAAEAANEAGIAVFVSSGNDGYCDAISSPACAPSAISVGAVYDADFGLYGPCVDEDSCANKTATGSCSTGWYVKDDTEADKVTAYSNSASFLDIFAPSNKAYTTYPVEDGSWSTSFGGTSAACPYAAGAAAVLQTWSKNETGEYLSVAALKELLTDSGDYVTDTKVEITKPRVNVANAVNGTEPTPPPPSENATLATPTILFWHNRGSGKVAYWKLANATVESQGLVTEETLSSSWRLSGVGDVSGDGYQDIVWHNQSSGKVAYWFVGEDGTRTASGLVSDQTLSSSWRLGATGDVNGDDVMDLFWHNQSSGKVAFWTLAADGTLDSQGTVSGQPLANSWLLAGSGLIDGDTIPDLVWHNQSTGKVANWLLSADGTLRSQFMASTQTLNSSWRLGVIEDLDGDGDVDFVWHNQSSGKVAYWLLNSGTMESQGLVSDQTLTSAWSLSGGGDVDADDQIDLFWHNQGSGRVAHWELTSEGVLDEQGLLTDTTLNSSWQMGGVSF